MWYELHVTIAPCVLFWSRCCTLTGPSKQRISESYERSSDIDTYDIFCSAHARYDYARINRIVPDAKHITVLREPASHFVSSWNYWNTASHIKAISGMDVTMEQVFAQRACCGAQAAYRLGSSLRFWFYFAFGCSFQAVGCCYSNPASVLSTLG